MAAFAIHLTSARVLQSVIRTEPLETGGRIRKERDNPEFGMKFDQEEDG